MDITVVLALGDAGDDTRGLDRGKLDVVHRLGCDLDLRLQLIDNIRAISKDKLNLQEVGMGVRNAATLYMAGLTTSLLHYQPSCSAKNSKAQFRP